MAARDQQQLASKEAGLFRQVVKFYESKQYKKGIKAADQILKKQPEHGETLAMKGLILCFQEKKEEANDYIRRGLRANLKSHVCWHVYGLLWRADNNYEEASKCYKNALRIDKDNLQILRDLAQLQIQMRDFNGLIETRQTLLHLKAANRNNWISFAIAYHLNKDYDLAVQVLNGFESTQEEIPKGEEYEHSEMLLYKVMILEESGNLDAALSELESGKENLRDSLGYEETKARLLLKKGSSAEAQAVYEKLLDLNPDNHRYHDGLRESLGLPTTSCKMALQEPQLTQLKELYAGLAEKYPRSSAPRRIPLEFLEGDEFEKALDAYVRPFLVKGIPSLFSDLKGLYRNAEKVRLIETRMEALASVTKEGADQPSQGEKAESETEDASKQEPFWAKVYLARHYDRLGNTDRALELLEECFQLDFGADEIELYCVKGKILKHAGDLEGAAAATVKAQSLDLADRYLNSVAAKALFRANHIEQAEKMAARFTKDSDQPNLLYEMQCMWYEIECGSAFLRRQDHGRALKNFTAVLKHFATFEEDQFDFHSYCVRKMTLRSYISMLRMEDSLLENVYYAKAAVGAVEVYLELASAPARQQQSLKEEEALLANMSLEDQKKHKMKRKKEAQKRAKEEERRSQEAEAASAARAKDNGKPGSGKKQAERSRDKDPDPDGAKLAAIEDPLAEAAKLLRSLRENAGDKLRTHALSFEVAMRRGKHLLALQAVKRAIALAGQAHPDVHRMIVRVCKAVSKPATENGATQDKAGSQEVVQEVIASQIQQILKGSSLASYQEAFRNEHGCTSLLHKAAALETEVLLSPERKQVELERLTDGDSKQHAGMEVSSSAHLDAIEVHKMLENRLCAQEAAETWAEKCRSTFPRSKYFQGTNRTSSEDLDNLFRLENGQGTSSVIRAQDHL